MKVREFLDMYDGNVEISVCLCDICNDDGDVDILKFMLSDRHKMDSRWINGEIEAWSICKSDESGAAFKLYIGIIKED